MSDASLPRARGGHPHRGAGVTPQCCDYSYAPLIELGWSDAREPDAKGGALVGARGAAYQYDGSPRLPDGDARDSSWVAPCVAGFHIGLMCRASLSMVVAALSHFRHTLAGGMVLLED